MAMQHLGRLWVVAGALGLVAALAPYSTGQSDTGTLRVAIRDKASGEVVPAMICITSLADKTWRVPPDGRTPATFSGTSISSRGAGNRSSTSRATRRNGFRVIPAPR